VKLTTKILRKVAVTGFGAIGLATFAISANAASLVTNGSFSTFTGASGGQLGYNTTATGWSVPSDSYTFLFTSGAQAGTGVTGQYGSLSLWGTIPNSPDGGAFIGADAPFQPGAISQTVGGLTVGAQYVLSFDWAAAQQTGFTGATDDWWTATLGGVSKTTSTESIASKGFSGWQTASFTFTANSTSELLSFLAGSDSTSGEPPFALLDGVSLTQVTSTPEPGSWTMLLGGLGLLAGARFTRAKNWFKR
jgi:PEP-CTERM motif-containing protein